MTFLRSQLMYFIFSVFCFSMIFSCKESSSKSKKTTVKVIVTEETKKMADSLYEAGRQLYYKRDFNTSVQTFLKADSLYQLHSNIPRLLKTRINIATALQATYIENDSIDRFLKAGIPLIEKLDKETVEVADYYNKLHLVNYATGDYAAAKSFVMKSYNLLSAMQQTDTKNYREAYTFALMAIVFNEQELFNYEAAEKFALLAVEYAKKNNYKQYNAEKELLNTYVLRKAYSKAKKQLQHIESANLIDEKNLFSTFDFYRAKIQLFRKTKAYDEALNAVNELQKIIDNSGYKEHFSQWFLTQLKSDIFLDTGKYKKVISFIKNLQIQPTYAKAQIGYRSDDFSRLAEAHYKLAAVAPTHEKQWQENIQKAINLHVSEDLQTTDFFKEVSYQNARFKDFLYAHLLFKAKAAFEMYQKTREKKYLKIALHTFKEAHANLKTLGAQSNEDDFIDVATFEKFYNDLLLAFHQKWIETKDQKLFFEALTISDERKNIFILNELKRTSEKKLFDNIPIEIRKKEAFLQAQKEETAFTSKNVQVQKEFAILKAEIREKYPKYYALKYGEEISIETVVSSQLEAYNCISYTVTNDYIFIFNYNAGNLQFDKIALDKTFDNALQTYIGSVSHFTGELYKQNGEIIFNTILKKYLDTSKPTVLFLDGNLNLIPFDVFREHIAYDKTFIRLNSLRQNVYNPQQNIAETIVFAPFFSENVDPKHTTQLPSSYKEATAIEHLTDAVMKTGKLALKQTFLETSDVYDVIHLSTHSKVDPELPLQSEILFYANDNQQPENYILKAKSLYDMNFSADLVTLSSCESGNATNQTGKGLQSIANAFHYAGAKSTVMSLWKVPDNTTAIIMKLFYENLKTGVDKATALQLAKKMYLEQTDDQNFKHPYYWAGFVISGDISPIVFPENSNTYFYYIFAAVSILFMLWIVYKRRKMMKAS